VTRFRWVVNGAEMVVVGMAAAVVAYSVGNILGGVAWERPTKQSPVRDGDDGTATTRHERCQIVSPRPVWCGRRRTRPLLGTARRRPTSTRIGLHRISFQP